MTTTAQSNVSIIVEINLTENKRGNLFIHHTHEHRFQPKKRDLYCVYEGIFRKTPVMHARFVVGNPNRRITKNKLIRQRSQRSLLQNRQVEREKK